MAVTVLIICALLSMYPFYGNYFKAECPTGLGTHMTLFEVVKEIGPRKASVFLRDANGQRSSMGSEEISR